MPARLRQPPQGKGSSQDDDSGEALHRSRTTWGDPNLEGIWNNATSTPLQRPERFGDKAVLAADEAEQVEEELAKTQNRDNRSGGPEAQVIAGYNEFWMDSRRLEFLKDRRTSLIVDPPDGRMPPRLPPTPEVAARAPAQRRRRASTRPSDDPKTFRDVRVSLNDRPPHLNALYNNNFRFTRVLATCDQSEMIHSARIIPGRTSASQQGIRQWQGIRGALGSATLVLETTNFRKEEGRFTECQPDTLKIVERFTRVGADRIDYQLSRTRARGRPWTA